MTRELVKRLADVYENLEGDPATFHDTVEDIIGENAQVLYWYHSHLEAFLPVIVLNENKSVWDIAHELVERWAPRPLR